MSQVNININATDNVSPLLSRIQSQLLTIQRNARNIRVSGSGGIGNFSRSGGNGFGNLLGPIAGIYSAARAVGFLTDGIKNLGKASLEQARTLDQVNKRLQFSYGGKFGAAGAQDRAMKFAESIGLEKVSSTEAFSKFSAAASESGLTTDESRKVFENTSKAIASFGLKSEDAKGVFLALSQMLNKGVVSSEELRRQLAERLPGAMAMAAKSMNMTMPEFMKQLTTGKIKSKEFVLALSELFGKKFSDQADKNIYSLEGQINNLSNAFTDLKSSIADSFGSSTLQLMESFADKLRTLSTLVSIFGGESRDKNIAAGVAKFAQSEEGKKLAEMVKNRDVKGIEKGLAEKTKASDEAILEFSKKIGAPGMEKIIGSRLSKQIIEERDFYKLTGDKDSRERLIQKSKVAQGLIQKAPQSSITADVIKSSPFAVGPLGAAIGAMEFMTGAAKNKETIEKFNKSIILGGKQYAGVVEAMEKTGIEQDAYTVALKDATAKADTGDLTGEGKDKLKTDYNTPKVLNINILTGDGASMVSGGINTDINTLEANTADIRQNIKDILLGELNDVVNDTATSLARVSKASGAF